MSAEPYAVSLHGARVQLARPGCRVLLTRGGLLTALWCERWLQRHEPRAHDPERARACRTGLALLALVGAQDG